VGLTDYYFVRLLNDNKGVVGIGTWFFTSDRHFGCNLADLKVLICCKRKMRKFKRLGFVKCNKCGRWYDLSLCNPLLSGAGEEDQKEGK
jgi:hypothetical protein